MKFENLVEIVRIKQEVREVEEPYTSLLPQQIRSSRDATSFIQALIGDEDREVFLVLCLSMKNHVIAVHRCHVGSLNASIVHPREVFKSAILNNAASILVAHNHPSGDCQYSPEDIDVSKRLEEAGNLLGIELLDSIIVSPSNSLSLKEKGVI
ncbi:JAB domain-containing protein [Planococcus lenghuensis]|uniref:DNA repair protein RadC n=1 Tax=Planococcus lenghuensis TaxID=2213202 RepID=A0A1Q2L581_9BACL|nr:JAB domain-containing protein [Planococcus lenghuensis]AQQ55573.1 DNA repair protein RadC [Planococcus lenghuensis]